MFLLVNPPFASLWRPNLGLSLLKASLSREGIESSIYYADHDLAQRLGVETYSRIHRDNELMIGEWLFSGLVRPQGWDLGFLPWLAERQHSPAELEALERVRSGLSDFVEQLCQRLLTYRPRMLGISSTFQQNNAALAILRRLRQLAPELVTVMGGANLEGELSPPLLEFDGVDFTVSGEAEHCIGPLYRLVMCFGREVPEAQLPPEVCSRRLRRPPGRGRINDLDALPHPDFDDYFASLKSHPALSDLRPTLTLEGSRGCWWGQVQHCTFCGLNGSGMNYRAKTPQRLLDEIFALTARHNCSKVDMVDNIIAPRHLKEVLPELARLQAGLEFFWEVKANLKPAHFALLAAAGVRWLQPGIESFSDPVLHLMRKGQRAIQNLLVLKAARENGIRLSWNILLGHPGESPEHVEEQCDLVESIAHLQPPLVCCEVRPDRFSPLFSELTDLQPFSVYTYIYGGPPERVQSLAYFFSLPVQPEPVRSNHQRSLRRLQRRVEAWQSSWSIPALRSLHLQGDAVVDQRWPGKQQVHPLSAQEKWLLLNCSAPTRLSELNSRAPMNSEELGSALARLQARRLCYCDDQQALSLVLSQPASQLPALP